MGQGDLYGEQDNGVNYIEETPRNNYGDMHYFNMLISSRASKKIEEGSETRDTKVSPEHPTS